MKSAEQSCQRSVAVYASSKLIMSLSVRSAACLYNTLGAKGGKIASLLDDDAEIRLAFHLRLH
jgi:hypothetical protein